MSYLNLFTPHVSVVDGQNEKHYFSILILVPEGTKIRYRNFDESEPGDQNDIPPTSKYKLEFDFGDHHDKKEKWYIVDGISRQSIRLGPGIDCDVIQIFRLIDDEDLSSKKAEMSLRVHGEHHKGMDKTRIFRHGDSVHLPGGSSNNE